MSHYVYRELLDAAIMSKRHGVRLQGPADSGDMMQDVSTDAAIGMAAAGAPASLFVHPASVHLLEPRLGDLIERDGCFYFVVTGAEHEQAERITELRNQTISLEVARGWSHPELTMIRMRGGETFMHPERVPE